MNTYQLDISILCLNRADRTYRDCVQAANIIEMRQSEYFTWEDDEQEPLSRSNAIHLAEKEMQGYPNVREFLSYLITLKNDEYEEERCASMAGVDNDYEDDYEEEDDNDYSNS